MSSASGGGGRRITITSISCRGIRAFVPFQKPPLYAAVSLGGRREKTPPDPDGGENADWDGAVFAFDLGGDGGQEQLVQFEVKAQVPVLGNKLVGTAGVPVADLASGGAAPRHVSYQVSAPDGKPNGTLSFAYAIGGGGARPQPQLYQGPDGAWPDQNPCFGCAAYPAPATASFTPHSGGAYPPPSPPVSASLYPPLQDLLAPTLSSYPPPPPPPNPQFLHPNSSSYPPPPAPVTAYPPPPASCTACPAPPAHYITSYPPPPSAPPTSYPPPPPGGYPPPVSDLPPQASTYPLPPLPETGSRSTVDRALPYYPAPPSRDAAIAYPPTAPPGGSYYYPPPGTRHPELGGAAGAPYHYPTPPGTRYP